MPELFHDLVDGANRKRQRDLDNIPAGAHDISLDRLLDGTVSVVKHDGGIPTAELPLRESPSDLLQYNGGGGCGVVDDRDLVDVVGVDDVLNYSSGLDDLRLELVEVEIVRLSEPLEL